MTLATLDRNMEAHCVLTYTPLFMDMRPLMFPCDAKGCVDLDMLDPLELNNYLFARALVGHAFAAPRVMARSRTVPDPMVGQRYR